MAFSGSERSEIGTIAKKEMTKFLKTTNAHNIVVKMIQKDMGTNKKLNDKVIELASKVVVELFKTLWQRKSFWEGPIKRVK